MLALYQDDLCKVPFAMRSVHFYPTGDKDGRILQVGGVTQVKQS